MMVDPKYAGKSVPFFLWQVVAITFEDFVIHVGKRYGVKEARWTHVVGWLWTFLWFCYSTPIFIDWAFAAGAAQHEPFKFSVVQPVMNHLSTLTGVDILGLITPAL